MDKRLVGMSTLDKVGPRGLVHQRVRVRRLSVVPSTGYNVDSYVYDRISKAQEPLFVARNIVTVIDDTIVEEGIEQELRPYVYHANWVTCLV